MEAGPKSRDSVRYKLAREDIINIDKKIERVNNRLETTNRVMDTVPRRINNIEEDFHGSTTDIEKLKHGQKVHELKLELLEKEVDSVRLGNDILLSHLRESNDRAGKYGQQDGNITNRSENKFDTGPMYTSGIELQDTRDVQSPGKQTPYYPLEQQQQQQQQQPQNGRDVTNDRDALTTADRKRMNEESERERLRKIYSVYDSTSINPKNWENKNAHKKYPWFDHKVLPQPGGLLFLRFDDAAYGEVKVVLRSAQQSICRHSGGYIMGVARKDRIFIYEDAPSKMMNWNTRRNQKYKDVIQTENAVVVFWFTKKEAAEQYFENGHHNRFREPCWPTANGYDAAFLPLITAPPMAPSYKTFMFVEFLDARRYRLEDMTQFEAEVRSDMSREVPGCLPFVCASQSGKVILKPGAFISPYSKVYVSRFESQKDVDRIWQIGLIQGLRHRYNMTGTINVFSFTIEELF